MSQTSMTNKSHRYLFCGHFRRLIKLSSPLSLSVRLIPMLPLVLLLPLVTSQELTLEVDSPRGRVRGFHVDYGNDTNALFYGAGDVFLGIPFAQPPVDELRFKLPVPLCKYNGTVGSTVYLPRCPQVEGVMESTSYNHSEDCLYLNVMTPSTLEPRKYPVMVWIHGGGYMAGGADIYAYKGAIRNLVSRGVVVVTLQYRLSLLGFFTTYTADFPPNRALYDQLTALQWVHEEIEYYGGAPDRVTIFGESAGGVSVSALSLSPLTHGIFHQIAMDSGSTYLCFSVPDDPRGDASTLQAQAICNVTGDLSDPANVQELQSCFSTMDGDELASYDVITAPKWTISRDGSFLPDDPAVLAKTRPPYPAIYGDMHDEYSSFIPNVAVDYVNASRDTLVQQMQLQGMNYLNEAQMNQVADMAIDTYRKKPVSQFTGLDWTKLTSDVVTAEMFDSSMVLDMETLHNRGSPASFVFTFTLQTQFSEHINIGGWTPVTHANELQYLWYYDYRWSPAAEADILSWKDYAAADNLGRAFTEFAKRGNAGWDAAGPDRNYVELNEYIAGGKTQWREQARVLFDVVYPSVLGSYPPTNISDADEQKLQKLGASVLQEWTSSQCKPSS